MNLDSYIRNIPNFPKEGILFKDITPLLSDSDAFQNSIDKMVEYYEDKQVDAIAACESRGFIFATPIALRMRRPFIPLRKPGKLPFETYGFRYELEYGSAELQMHIDAVKPGANVLMVDDLLATGGTMDAGCRLIEKAGGNIAGCAFLIELNELNGREKLKDYDVYSILNY